MTALVLPAAVETWAAAITVTVCLFALLVWAIRELGRWSSTQVSKHVDAALDPRLADHSHIQPAPIDHAQVARIRAQIKANHDAECARFRAELDQFGGGVA